MKFIRAFPQAPNPDVEFYINPDKISHAMIVHDKDNNQYQLWINIHGDSFHLANFDSKLAAKEKLSEIVNE